MILNGTIRTKETDLSVQSNNFSNPVPGRITNHIILAAKVKLIPFLDFTDNSFLNSSSLSDVMFLLFTF